MTSSEETASEARADARKIRQLLIEPGRVSLVTQKGFVCDGEERRFISDEFVFLNVTGRPAVDGLPDGKYRVSAASGLVAIKGIASLNVVKFLSAITGRADWYPVRATKWSLAENDAKAMLVYAEDIPRRTPMLINEDLWTALSKEFDHVVSFDADMRNTVHPTFRARSGKHIFAYVAGIPLPEDEASRAQQIVNTGP